MTAERSFAPLWHRPEFVILIFVGIKLLLHAAFVTEYGYFRDELYYIACSNRLDFGYVDHPPLSILLLRISRALFGDSLPALRLLPALAGAATVYLTGKITQRLGGSTLAIAIACTAVVFLPVQLAVDHFFSMNAFDILLWVIAAYRVLIVLETPTRRNWAVLGVVLGLGLLNKISMLWFGAGLGVALLATRHRSHCLTAGPWIAALVAMLLFLPHILWQVANGWPTLEFIANATQRKMTPLSPVAFAWVVTLSHQPVFLPLWGAGLIGLLFWRQLRAGNVLGIIFVTVVVILLVNGTSRANYLTPAFPPLFAAGSIVLARWAGRARRAWVPASIVFLTMAGTSLAIMPLAVPVLPVETYIAYESALGIQAPKSERSAEGRLKQHYADMHGWKELAADVAKAYAQLTPAERENALIFAQNYGQAGAVEFFGAEMGLPRVISGHNSYWLWGPGDASGGTVIVIGGDREDLDRQFASVEVATVSVHPYRRPFENNLPIYICREMKFEVTQEIWQRLKNYI